jgi:site-specific DNA-cytosine methylase
LATLSQNKTAALIVTHHAVIQVEALLDRVKGRPAAIQTICDTFEGLGYRTWAYRTICSAGFGMPLRRKRVFFLASMHGDARDVLLSMVSD